MNPSDDERPSRRRALQAVGAIGAAAAGGAVIAAALGSSDGNSGGTTGTLSSGGVTQAARTLRMVTTWPRDFPGLGTGAERLARRIEAASGGALRVIVHAAGELVPALAAFDAVSSGKADLYHGAEYYWQGRSPAFNFFAAVPMGLTAAETNAWIRFGGGQQLWDRLSARFNIKPLIAGNTGVQMGGWFKRPIRSLADFQGLRIRMPGLGGEVMKRLGATPVTKAGGELFQALDQGNIDASEWVGPWNDMAFSFHSIVKNYHYPGIHEPGTTLSLGVNLDLWDALSPTERAIMETAAAAETIEMFSEFEQENAAALERLLKMPDINIAPFPDEVLRQLAEISEKVLAEVAAGDAFTGEVYRSFRAARARGERWGAISERAFAHARSFLPEGG
ncbi:MAG: TRAP transporter substrate-binding protein [Rhodothalassiaceae bacterium]